MDIFLTNNLTNKKEQFVPKDKSHIGMYVCGPTVYDDPHIGNARPLVIFDTLFRLLKNTFSKVTYVRNITDVDDKINEAAKKLNQPISAITNKYTDIYHKDMKSLCVLSMEYTQEVNHADTSTVGTSALCVHVMTTRLIRDRVFMW